MGIDININASDKRETTDITAVGSVEEIISDTDRDAFQLTDDNLRKASGIRLGEEPVDVYVKNPTPGDLYDKYNWKQVTKTVKPLKATVVGVETERVTLAEKQFTNESSLDATYNATMNQQVSNTVSSSWTNDNEISVDEEISYKVDFIGAGAGGNTSLSYTNSWGEEYSETKVVVLGWNSTLEVTVKPGQSVTTVLSATKVTVDVEVEYDVTLDGQVAISYPDGYKDHHFYGLDVNDLMEAVDLKPELNSKEMLKIVFYTDENINM